MNAHSMPASAMYERSSSHCAALQPSCDAHSARTARSVGVSAAPASAAARGGGGGGAEGGEGAAAVERVAERGDKAAELPAAQRELPAVPLRLTATTLRSLMSTDDRTCDVRGELWGEGTG